jgi:hypothetical protein
LIQGKNVVGFRQATIKVEREKEFEELKGAIVRAFEQERVEKFLKRVHSAGCRVRNLEPILANGILEKSDDGLAKSGTAAQKLYQSLTVSDQAQMREFYLSKVEEVAPELRAKYQKIYRYY